MSEDIGKLLLGVKNSVNGKRWLSRLEDERLAAALAQRLEVQEVVGRVLAARNVGLDDASSFLNPKLKTMLPNPSHLLDMQSSVDRILKAIKEGEVIGVLGDYDVDGATSSALIVRFFSELGLNTPVYIPDRQKEGYGPNLPGLLKLQEKGAHVVITVDCGTTAFAPLEAAAAAGIDIIVVDHHVAEPKLPTGARVINPNRADEHSTCGQLAAVGVTFLLIVAINRALREKNWYNQDRPEPNLMSWLDLVALGTICDVVPLTGLNRALVKQGLKVLASRENKGIAALAEVANVDKGLDAYDVGFVLGPRVNAGGRVGDSALGVKLLTTEDQNEAAAIANLLDDYNTERREIESAVLEAAIAQAEEQDNDNRRLIIVAGKNWHPGVIGIVAGRLRERFGKPSCVLALSEGMGKGSGRSVKGVALGPAVIAAHQAGILVNGGGHNMAAGFMVKEDKLAELDEFLMAHISRQLDGKNILPTLMFDGVLSPAGASVDLIQLLDCVGPFGSGNPRPRFGFPQVRVVNSGIVGKDHVRCVLTGVDGGETLKAIAFRSAGTAMGNTLMNTRGLPLHVAGNLRLNEWQGRVSPQLFIDDVASA
ncbi:MAG: single-stranded-DNA-specific exonuclease RecJ [Rhodospirillaceae bacterium]|nr:single-stranded-DNA-specific exonuclease RecJ [Rhodospirillaceae bacterium]